MRVVALVGWACFALDALFVGSLYVARNMGDDAAGRGLATGWAMILTAPLLVAGALLLWGTLAESRAAAVAAVVGTLLTAAPFVARGVRRARNASERAAQRAWLGEEARFADPALGELADAVVRGDTAAVRAIVARGPRDWSQRDPWGQTVLGFAVKMAGGTYANPNRGAVVRVMLEQGVPYAPDAQREGGDWFADVAASAGDDMNEVIEAALKAGADPNVRAPFDDDPLVLSANMTAAKLDLLARHGADLQARSSRGDRRGWSTLMNAAYRGQWPEALFFLRHGVDPAYRAPDGKTVREAMAEGMAFHDRGPGDAGHDAFVAALGGSR